MANGMIGPKFYGWDENGLPLAGGKLYTYETLTNTPKATYDSEDQDVANANPIILNSEGYADVYLDGSYKMVLKDSNDNDIWTTDPVSSTSAEEWVNCTAATYISATSVSIVGNQTKKYEVGKRIRIDNDTGTYSYSTILTSIYGSGVTTITISDSFFLVGVLSICSSIIGPESRPTDRVLEFANLAEAVASTLIEDGDSVNLKERDTGSGGGAFWDVVLTSTVTTNTFNIVQCVGEPLLALVLRLRSTLVGEEWGIYGNNAGTPYGNLFREFMIASASNDVSDVTLPNKTIEFDNSAGPASFQSNCTYKGGRNTFIQPTDFSQRVFLTQSKGNFEIRKIRSYINEGSGGEDDYIGGGYWRFESCTYFDMYNCEVSKSFGGGFKFVLCVGFNLRNLRANYNQFTGCEYEGCDTYTNRDYDFSFNGRYSSNQNYKPLPTAWSGTHGGRGVTIGASGNVVDQNYSLIENGRCQKNSEYGIRCYTASTKGITNLTIKEFLIENSGAPAGTYGTVVLGSNKGVDLLINSDASGESDNIEIKSGQINSEYNYGNHISVDGYNHRLLDVTCKNTGLAVHARTPISLFGAKDFEMDGCRTHGASNSISFGSNAPADVTIINDIAYDCLNYINGNSTGGINIIRNVKAFHRSTTAVAGEEGFNPDGVISWMLEDVTFYDFYQGFVVGSSATTIEANRVKTIGTVTNGLRDFSTGGADIIYNGCQFDSATPSTRGSQVGGAGDNTQWAVGISWIDTIPTTGWYKAGHIVWKVNPGAVDGTHGRYLAGWHRLITGTAHVAGTDWREMWVHDDATTA